MTTNQGMVPVPDAIISLVPGAQFISRNDEIEWLDTVIPMPSTAAITAERIRLYQQYITNQYQRDRALAYPSITDQLDTLFHEGYDGWKAAVQAIKDQFPKP